MRALSVTLFALLSLFVGFHDIAAIGAVRTVAVNGDRLLYDGLEVVPKGVIMQSFLHPVDGLDACEREAEYCKRLLDGQDFYFARGKYSSKGALDVAADWQVDTIRFNVSQSALSPDGADHSQEYVDEITRVVNFARQKGFAVILALFDGRNTNAPKALLDPNPVTPLNDATSLAAAELLAKQFGKDPGVMIELLNEPWSPTGRRKGWLLWRDGGTAERGRFAGRTFVGVNQIIAKIRATGARNVVIVQGIGASFRGFPGGLEDPLNSILYSVHPFLGSGDAKKLKWDENFGEFAEKNPFLITAWNSPARKGWCSKLGLGKPAEFLAYIREKRIGLVAYALDVPGRLLRDFRNDLEQVSGYGDECADGGSAGELIKQHFLSK